MTDKQHKHISKFLSKHLRHDPAGIGLVLEEGGWVSITALLDSCQRAGVKLTRDELDEIATTSDKQRYSFDETGERIRANQGHSVDVDLQLEPAIPPHVLFHGTATHIVDAILRDGLLKMRRHHVHLSKDIETATRVGQRHGRPVVFRVDAAAMARQGVEFFLSANGVWLTEHVPPEFLAIEEEST
jgi:putative RNA 2'-phosphotransferase